MIDLTTLIAAAALAGVVLMWLVPRTFALDAMAGWTLAVFAWLSWPTALWLALIAVATPLVLRAGERTARRGLVAGGWALLLVAGYLAAQTMLPVIWIGTAFFTLRALHVTGEWWMGRLPAPSVRAHCRYQLFLPVLFVGPIHRLQHFERQAERRRWDPVDLAAGAERVLTGLFWLAVFGQYLVAKVRAAIFPTGGDQQQFAAEWLDSAISWVSLYFTFAGLSGMALGLALMAGLKLEENFDHPWRATSLIDFWSRWHITLTTWCRDYVYLPVMALTRSAVTGLAAAMLVIGLWHELSFYYVLWSVWQTLGVLINRAAARMPVLDRVPAALRRAAAPMLILGWLSLARPVVNRLLEMIG